MKLARINARPCLAFQRALIHYCFSRDECIASDISIELITCKNEVEE